MQERRQKARVVRKKRLASPDLTNSSLILNPNPKQLHRMGDGAWDINSIPEEEFEQRLAVYLVPDAAYDESQGVKKAEATLPRNLVLKPTQAHGQPNNVSTRNCE